MEPWGMEESALTLLLRREPPLSCVINGTWTQKHSHTLFHHIISMFPFYSGQLTSICQGWLLFIYQKYLNSFLLQQVATHTKTSIIPGWTLRNHVWKIILLWCREVGCQTLRSSSTRWIVILYHVQAERDTIWNLKGQPQSSLKLGTLSKQWKELFLGNNCLWAKAIKHQDPGSGWLWWLKAVITIPHSWNLLILCFHAVAWQCVSLGNNHFSRKPSGLF